jgi:hypothetical protein
MVLVKVQGQLYVFVWKGSLLEKLEAAQLVEDFPAC